MSGNLCNQSFLFKSGPRDSSPSSHLEYLRAEIDLVFTVSLSFSSSSLAAAEWKRKVSSTSFWETISRSSLIASFDGEFVLICGRRSRRSWTEWKGCPNYGTSLGWPDSPRNFSRFPEFSDCSRGKIIKFVFPFLGNHGRDIHKTHKGGVGAAESRKIPLKVMKFLFDVFCTLYESFNNVNKSSGGV